MPPGIAEGPADPQHPVLRDMAKFWDYDSHFDPPSRERAKRAYFGLCSFLDDNIRQVLAALEDSGAAGETLVLYISDHGEMLGNHGFWTKSVMYEDAVGIPLIMSGRDVPAGVGDTPVSLTDIAATVESAVGLRPRPAEAPWQSRPLQEIAAAPDPARFLLSQYHDGGSPTGFFMIRQEDWKYVHYAGGHPPHLFNTADDPEERNDLGEDPDFERQRERLQGRLTEILDPEAVNDQAFADQAALLQQLGGREAVMALPGFNHTPVG
jgi:choline-sulfatase